MADDDEEEWRFSVDEVGPDDPDEGDAADGDADADAEDWSVTVVGENGDGPTAGPTTGEGEDESEETDGGGGNVAGTLAPDESVEPGTPSLENAAFATAGAALTALVFAAVLGRLDPVTVAAIAGAVVGGAGLLYVLFRRF